MFFVENLLERNFKSSRGATLVGAIVAVVVGTILIALVAIPVIDQAITDANITGTPATVLRVTGTLLAIVPIVMVSQML